MTPFAQYLLLAVIGVLIVVLLVRIALRWYRDHQSLSAMSRPPMHASRAPDAATSRTHTEVTTPPPVQSLAESTPPQRESTEYQYILKEEPVTAASSATDAPNPPTAADPSEYSPYFPAAGQRPVTAETTAQAVYDADEMPFADKSDYSFGPVTPMLAAMLPESHEKKHSFKRMLKNAGYYTPHAWHNLAATRYLGLILPIILFGGLLIMVPQQLEWPIIGCLIAFPILGYALPGLLVQSQAAARIKDIEQGMPDMLDMLNMCVSQGMTLPNSLQRVGQELRGVYPDLSKELAITSDQARIAGLPAALQSFTDRVDSPDVHSFTSLLMQTEQMGTSVSGALGDYAENMREGLRQRADLKGNSATFKLLFPTVLCLMPAVFLFLLGPAIVQLHEFYNGGGTQILRNEANTVIRAQQPEQ